MLQQIKFKVIILIISFFVFIPSISAMEKDVDIYIIHSNTCPHCKEELEFFKLVENKYNNINVYKYEVHKDNLDDIKNRYKIDVNSVPVTIINDTIYNGFSENSKVKILKTIEYYSKDRNISLNKYIKSTNYKLFGNISIDRLDNSTLSIIIGIMSVISINSIIGIIAVAILLLKENDFKNKIILLFHYIVILVLLSINNIIFYSSSIISIGIYMLLFLVLILYYYKYYKTKSRVYLNSLIVIFVGIINKVLELLLFNNNLNSLVSISNYELVLINKGIYFFTYLFSYIIFSMLLLIGANKINSKLKI